VTCVLCGSPNQSLTTMSSTNIWTKRHLTWALHVGGAPGNMTLAQLQKVVWDCFDQWQHAGVFTFFPSDPTATRSDIHIKFAEPPTASFRSTSHTPRLGFGYPPWCPHWRGFIYLDPDARWSDNYWHFSRHYLPAVLAHEIGRMLGLSQAPEGVMRDGYTRNLRVTGADLQKLRALYQHIEDDERS
jgi:hypothetical protein